jgi:hypothetical protein
MKVLDTFLGIAYGLVLTVLGIFALSAAALLLGYFIGLVRYAAGL